MFLWGFGRISHTRLSDSRPLFGATVVNNANGVIPRRAEFSREGFSRARTPDVRCGSETSSGGSRPHGGR